MKRGSTRTRSLAILITMAAGAASWGGLAPPGLPPACAAAPAPADLKGEWRGLLATLHLIVHLEAGESGALTGTVDVPEQNASGLRIDKASLQEGIFTFELSAFGAEFRGAVSESGDEISGTWKQGQASLPLTLRRGAASHTLARKPQEPVGPYPYRAEEVGYEGSKGAVHLAGTLTLPEGNGPFPGVLLLTGSGPENRDEAVFGHRPFLVLADYLTRRGVAVLRVDDRGVGGSTGSLAGATIPDLAEDALAGVAYLRRRPEIDPARVGLIGHSEGGMVAPLAASRSTDVSFIVLLAGVGVPMDRLLLTQSAAMRRLAGAPDSTVRRERALLERVYAALKSPGDSANVDAGVRPLVQELLAGFSDEQLGGAGGRERVLQAQMRQLLSPDFRALAAYDPRPALRKVSCPVLALNGQRDSQVDARENLPAIAGELRAGGNENVTTRSLPGLNHLFQTCETGSVAEYARIDETFAPAALEEIGSWIAKRSAPGRTGATKP